jgi:hypothetical protein
VTQNQRRGLIVGGLQNEGNIMKQIIIRMFVALTMCGVTSLIRLTSFVVISPTLQLHNEAIWISRLILASVLSPLLYGFLDRRTSTGPSDQSINASPRRIP